MAQSNSGRGLAADYAATAFLSAFLLFQVLLFGGYAYAHLTTRYVSPARQGWLHLSLLALALVMLPVMPDASWKPASGDAPVLRIILLTLSTVGLPYFILSSTGPLVQGWFS